MHLPSLLAVAVLLTGCSNVSTVREAWHWDATAPQRTAAVLPADAALTNRLAELQIQRIDIRTRISAEPDIRARLRLYQELHAVGLELSPLERRLVTGNVASAVR